MLNGIWKCFFESGYCRLEKFWFFCGNFVVVVFYFFLFCFVKMDVVGMILVCRYDF